MGSYIKYNQAMSQEKQLNEIEENIKPQVQEQIAKVESSENSYNKNLRTAVVSNKNIDIRKASTQKKEFEAAKREIAKPLRQIDQEREKLSQIKKSAVKTPSQLESEGYKQEIRGDQVIYYKEDTYKKRSKDKNNKIYRDEEYIFQKDGTPIKFIERNDYQDGDKRRVDEEQIVRFDSKGRVSQVTEYDNGEKQERTSYNFDAEGSMTIEFRNYEKEKKEAEKLARDSKIATNSYQVEDKKTGRTIQRTHFKDGHIEDKVINRDVHEVKISTTKSENQKEVVSKSYGKTGDLISTEVVTYEKHQSKVDQDPLKELNIIKSEESIQDQLIKAPIKIMRTTPIHETIGDQEYIPATKQNLIEQGIGTTYDWVSTARKNVVEVGQDLSEDMQNIHNKEKQKPDSEKNTLKTIGTGVGSFAVAGVTTAFAGITAPFFVETYEGIIDGVHKFVLNPKKQWNHISHSAGQFGSRIMKGDPTALGELAGGIAATKVGVSEVAQVTSNAAKGVYIKIGSKYVAPEKIFAESVMQGKEMLPTARSVSESVGRFEKADNIVQTSAPAKISGKEAGVGKKASQGFEDPGIYVTPAGEGSPYFLRIENAGKVEYSMNPVKGVNGNIPTVTRFKASSVEQLPRDVVNQPGFTAVKEFHEAQSGSGKVFITKRSELGQGNLKRQVNPETNRLEAGTSEIEAVIPVSQGFEYIPQTFAGKIKGFDHYTKWNGKPVAVRDAALIVEKQSTKVASKSQGQVISGERIVAESDSLSQVQQGVKQKTPYSKVSIAGYNSNPFGSASDIFNDSTSSFQKKSEVSSSPGASLSKGSSTNSVESIENPGASFSSTNSKVSSSPGVTFSKSGSSIPGGDSGGGSSGGSNDPVIEDPFDENYQNRKSKKKEKSKKKYTKNKKSSEHEGEFAGSLTALFQGVEVAKLPKNKKTTGMNKRSILRGRGW